MNVKEISGVVRLAHHALLAAHRLIAKAEKIGMTAAPKRRRKRAAKAEVAKPVKPAKKARGVGPALAREEE